MTAGTYVYCVSRPAPARATRVPPGLRGMGAAAADIRAGRLVVADAPLGKRRAAINRRPRISTGLARRGVARSGRGILHWRHRLPDEAIHDLHQRRACARTHPRRARAWTLVRRVAKHHEWGVRVVLDRSRRRRRSAAPAATRHPPRSGRAISRRRKRSATQPRTGAPRAKRSLTVRSARRARQRRRARASAVRRAAAARRRAPVPVARGRIRNFAARAGTARRARGIS